MTDSDERLMVAKKNLVQALGSKEKEYWGYIKAWFKHKINKEEFDMSARSLLCDEHVVLHNQFFLAVLTKCHISDLSGSQDSYITSQKARNTRRHQSIVSRHEHRFRTTAAADPNFPLKPYRRVGSEHPAAARVPVKRHDSPFVPSPEDVFPITLAVAWENGLDSSNENVASYLALASEVFMKNLISGISTHRSSHKILDKCFQFSAGDEPMNPYLLREKVQFGKNSLRFETSELKHIEDLGRTNQRCTKTNVRLSLRDFLHALKYQRQNMIHKSSFYDLTFERVNASVWHPDHETPTNQELKLMTQKCITNNNRRTNNGFC